MLGLAVFLFRSDVAGQDNTVFELVNQSALTINRIYVSSTTQTSWGTDRLGEDVLPSGRRLRIDPGGAAGCTFDIRVEYSDDRVEERRSLNLCTLSEVAFDASGARAADRTPRTSAINTVFEVVNNSTKPIYYIYVSPASSTDWGRDWLGSEVLEAGGRFRVSPGTDNGCTHDVRVVYSDEQTEDRRNQDLCNVSELVFAGASSAPAPESGSARPPAGRSFGTGFFVSAQGHALTNEHVVEGCGTITAITRGGSLRAEVLRRDGRNDLALLRVRVPEPVAFGRFRSAPGIRAGDGVVVAGFPLPDVLQNGLNVTVGNVSALAGLGGNTALLQMTAPVQPGNSGGPLLDMAGNVVGVVVSKLDAMRLAERTGDIPQNVNFAVQGAIARLFLEAEGQRPLDRTSTPLLDVGDVVDAAREFTFQIECRP